MASDSTRTSPEPVIISIISVLGWPFIVAYGLLLLTEKIRTELIIAGMALTGIGAIALVLTAGFSAYLTTGVFVAIIAFIVYLLNIDVSDVYNNDSNN